MNNLSYFGLILSFFLPLCLSEQRKHKIYWNTTNTFFQPAYHKVWKVQADDTIIFYCPNDHNSGNKLFWSYDVKEFENCRTGDKTHPLLDCANTSPGEGFELNVFTINMLPGSPVFEIKKPVYFFAQSNLCMKKNLKVEILRIDPLAKEEEPVGEKRANDDSSVSIKPPVYSDLYNSRSSFEQYRYLIIMAVFAGILLVGIHIVLCLAWLPRRLKRNLSNLKNIENSNNNHSDMDDPDHSHLIREKSLFSSKTFSTPNNNADINETLRNLAYQQISNHNPNEMYIQNGAFLNQHQQNLQFTTQAPSKNSTLTYPLPPTAVYAATPFQNLIGNPEFLLADFSAQNSAAFLLQQNEFQKQLQLQLTAHLALNQQQQQIYQQQSIYDVPRDSDTGQQINGDHYTETLNKTRNKKTAISTNPHHTSRRKKS